MGLVFESVTWDLVFLAASLALFLYLRIKKRLRTFEEAGIPYIPAKSFFENNTFGLFSKESLGESFDGLYKQLAPHKYGGIFSSLRPCILLRDPATINRLLTTEFQSFNDHGIPTDEETNPLEANLFFLSGPKWKALRRKLSPTFTSGKLKWMFPLIGDCADDLIAKMSQESEAREQTDTSDLLARFTTDVIGSCAFGLEPESIKNPRSRFRIMGKKVFEPPLYYVVKGTLRLMFPYFFRVFHIQTQDNEVWKFFESLTLQTISHRISTGKKRNDFVQLLVQLKEKGFIEPDPTDLDLEDSKSETEDHEPLMKIEFTDQLLAAQAFVFFIAGFESTASAIGFTLYLLAKETEAQEKARKEVEEVSGGKITYKAVTGMPYLNACIKEAMRIHPPIQLLSRVASKDFTMDDGKKIKKGTTVLIPVYSLHRDPDYFPSPLEFRPERFMGEEAHVPGSYLPFGQGPRICIAWRFALLEAGIAVAKILDNFKISISSKMETPLKTMTKTFVVAISGGLWLNFEKIH